jgi:lipopolysaccharide export system permease protein
VINEVQRNRFFLRAARIDQGTYVLRDVTIFDLSDQERKRVIYADSGHLALTPNQEDAELTLHDGVIHEFDRQDQRMFQQAAFTRQVIRVEGVGNELQRTLSDTYKGDREMGICEMEGVVLAARREAGLMGRRAEAARRNALRVAVGLAPVTPDTASLGAGGVSPYCRLLRSQFAFLLPQDLRAQARPVQDTAAPALLQRFDRPARTTLRAGAGPLTRGAEFRTLEDRARAARIRAAHYLVEIHKKYAIATACLVFVLVGVPMALRFPGGGVGLVIGASLTIFAVYYIGLIAGESLANKLIVPVGVMWVPNVISLAVGLVLLRRARYEATTTRGGDWRDALRRLLGRRVA